MKNRPLFLLPLLFILSTLTAWAEVSFKATAPRAVAVGQQFRVEYSVTARANGITVDLENKGFDVLYGPSTSSSTSTSIINGQVNTEVRTTFSYVLQAQKEGMYTLPAASIKVHDKLLTSNAVDVRVLPADTQPADAQSSHNNGRAADSDINSRRQAESGTDKFNKDDVHLVLDLSKTNVYEGEPIVATLKLYWRNTQMSNPSDVKLPTFEGFTVQDMDNNNAQATLEHYQGNNYQAYPLCKWLLFPSRSGELTIPSASLRANIQVVTTRRMAGFFDLPMEYTQNVEVPLQSAVRKVKVRALPEGRPASYMGAVGDFKIKSQLTASEVQANDAVIYKITVEGVGNLKYAREPKIDFPTDFEVFDPKIDLNTNNTAQGMSGKKTIEYTLIPRHPGTYTLPAIDFGYFDTKSGQYKTAHAEERTLTVTKGVDNATPSGGNAVDFTGANQERIRVLGNDIRYLHPIKESALHAADKKPFYGTWLYWLFYAIPLLAFVILSFIYRRRIRRLADVAGTRTRRAGKVAERRLKEASKALKAHDENAYYEAIHKAIVGYICDKMRIPTSDLSMDTIAETLQTHNVSENTIKEVRDVLDTCQMARYASSGVTGMEELYQQTSKVIDQLENEIRK